MKKKKIVYLVGTLNTGGLERLVCEWSLYLIKNTAWEPSVVCLNKKKGDFLSVLENSGIIVYECPLRNGNDSLFILRLASVLRQINPDVVHSQVAFSMPWQVIGIRLAGIKKVIFTQHNEYQNWRYFFSRLRIVSYFLLAKKFITHYTCVSERVRQALSTLTFTPIGYFKVIPNAVDTQRFFPQPELRHVIRMELGLADDLFLIGTVARFSYQKGHTFLIESCALLKSEKRNFKLILVGDGELKQDIIRLVKHLDLSDHVVFLGLHESVERLLQGLDCFILPSLWEGMPMSLLEAMASGIPVIGTEVTGTSEVLVNQQNGILVEPKNPHALFLAIRKYMEDNQFRNKMRLAAIKTIENEYTIRESIKSYLRLYE